MAYHSKGVLFVVSALVALWNGWELTSAIPVYVGWVYGGESAPLAWLLIHTFSFVVFSGFTVRYGLLLGNEDEDAERRTTTRRQ